MRSSYKIPLVFVKPVPRFDISWASLLVAAQPPEALAFDVQRVRSRANQKR